MLDERVQEIGQFYLNKHNGDYAAAEKEVRSLDVQQAILLLLS